MGSIVVRQLSPDDWEVERDLRLAALTDAPSAFGSTLAETLSFAEHDWRQRLVGQVRFAAWLDGVAVGTIGCAPARAPYPKGAAVLVGTWVAPTARGRGVADRLVATVTGWCQHHGYPELWLSVTHGNVAAERLYVRQGFERTGTDLEGDGDTFDMRLSLGR